ncbi:hypothetical protein BH11PLA1_BH11PLA1_20650 [soil metagenome]
MTLISKTISTLSTRTLGAAGIFGALTLMGCAANSGSAGAGRSGTMEENAVNHVVSPADLATAHSTAAIPTENVTLWINGMGCPQCVTNVDLQLERIRGAKDVRVDLGSGKVTARFVETPRPSPQDLFQAVDNAGLTLVKVEAGQ